MSRGLIAFIAGLVLVLGGSWYAHSIQTTGGVEVQDVRFPGADGVAMSGLLYVPKTATPARPAPGILAVHGYINSRETQDGFAIEFARRGYVVLAMDQTGHGYSGGAAYSAGFGGPAGLTYLRSLPMVDRANIGLEGHSMGGWTILAAAAAMPNDYKAMVLEGSSTGKPFAQDGSTTWPRNLGLVFSRYDEFAKFMWGVDRAMDVGQSPKLKAVFGTASDVKPGAVYGSIAEGTARRLTTPATTHPGDHISADAIGDSLDWFAKTLKGGTPLPASDQVWFGKEAGTGLALIGVVWLILGTFDLLLKLPAFAGLRHAGEPSPAPRDGRWWRWLALTAFLPVLTYFPCFLLVSQTMKPSWLLPQTINNEVIVWALVNSAIILILPLFSRQPAHSTASKTGWIAVSAISVLSVGAGYLALLAMDALFKVDFRFWVVALKLPNAAQTAIIPHYLPAFVAFFLIALSALHKRLVVKGDGWMAQYAYTKMALAGGFTAFLALDYGLFFLTGSLPTAIDPLSTVVMIQFVPLMAIAAIISVFTWRRTNSHVPGALISALLISWYVVAGTATHVI